MQGGNLAVLSPTVVFPAQGMLEDALSSVWIVLEPKWNPTQRIPAYRERTFKLHSKKDPRTGFSTQNLLAGRQQCYCGKNGLKPSSRYKGKQTTQIPKEIPS